MPRVILWTSHRCASTVFERSIRELETVKVIHEPHCMAFFADVGSIRDEADSLFEQAIKVAVQACDHEIIKLV